jgi:hypothetical protein
MGRWLELGEGMVNPMVATRWSAGWNRWAWTAVVVLAVGCTEDGASEAPARDAGGGCQPLGPLEEQSCPEGCLPIRGSVIDTDRMCERSRIIAVACYPDDRDAAGVALDGCYRRRDAEDVAVSAPWEVGVEGYDGNYLELRGWTPCKNRMQALDPCE